MEDEDVLLPQFHPGLLQKKSNTVSSFVKGGLALMVTAVIDMVVAFSTSYWATWSNPNKGEHGGYGLWKIWHCSPKGFSPISAKTLGDPANILKDNIVCQEKMADLSFPGWYVTVQVFGTLGLAGLLASLIMLLLYVFLPKWERSKTAMSTLIAIAYISGLFIVVALAVFGFMVAEEIEMMGIHDWILSWSFSLACTAFVLNQIAASILITENKRLESKTTEKSESQYKSQSFDHNTDFKTSNETNKLLPLHGISR